MPCQIAVMLKDLHLSRGCAAAFAAVGIYWGAFGALVPDLKPQVGLSDGGFGAAMLVSTAGAVAAMWAAPWIERVLGLRAVPVLACAVALAFVFPGLAVGGVSFALAMMLAAMASGTLDVAMNARLSVLESVSGRPLMNLNHGIFSLAYALSAVFTGLAREAGWSPLMVFSALGLVVLLLLAPMILSPVPDPDRVEGAPEPAPISWAVLAPAGLIVLVGFMAEQGTEGWSALHLERGLGAGAAEGALGPAILGFTMALGRFSGQAVAHRMSEAVVLSLGASLSAMGAVVAAWADGLAMAYAGFAMLGLGVSVVAPMAFAWVGRLVAVERKALAISRVAVLGYAGFFLGPPMMGGLSELAGLAWSFTAVAGLLILVPLVLVPVLRRRGAPA